MEPRECRGKEQSLDQCPLRLTGHPIEWQCMDNEHFNYIHCGSNRSTSDMYIGNWGVYDLSIILYIYPIFFLGGITFGSANLETVNDDNAEERSILRHVEIVGGGLPHNDSLQSASLQIIRRSAIVENVNVTNSSMHAIQVD